MTETPLSGRSADSLRAEANLVASLKSERDRIKAFGDAVALRAELLGLQDRFGRRPWLSKAIGSVENEMYERREALSETQERIASYRADLVRHSQQNVVT